MKPKVLVVGGAGYIGGCLVDYLLSKKIPFDVFDNLTYQHYYLKPVPFIYGDVRDRKLLQSILPQYRTVVWLAALVGDGACAVDPAITREVNVESVKWLSKEHKGRIIFASTCSVYGANDSEVHEGSYLDPLSLYAKAKLEAEKYLPLDRSLILRFGTAYGLGDAFSRIRLDLAINVMTMHGMKFGELSVFGGSQWRPFIHVKDIAKALSDHVFSDRTGIYNLATENLRLVDAAKQIQSVTNCRINTVKEKFQDNRNYHVSIRKAMRDKILSMKGKRTIRNGAEEIAELYRNHRVKDLDHIVYSNEKFLKANIDQYALVQYSSLVN